SVEGDMAEQNRQEDDAPEQDKGIVVASLASCGVETVEQRLIGNGVEEVADGDEGRVIFQLSPSEERLCGVDKHGAPPWRKEADYSARDRPSSGCVGEKS